MSYLDTLKTGVIPEKKAKSKKITPYDRYMARKRPDALPGAAKVSVTTPAGYNDVRMIVGQLLRNRGTVMDFKGVPPVTAQRLLDFLSGAVYAIGGRIERIGDGVYLVTPKGVEITCAAADGDEKRSDG